jgi:hypothetical protein
MRVNDSPRQGVMDFTTTFEDAFAEASVGRFPALPPGRVILSIHLPGMVSPANFLHSFGVHPVAY